MSRYILMHPFPPFVAGEVLDTAQGHPVTSLQAEGAVLKEILSADDELLVERVERLRKRGASELWVSALLTASFAAAIEGSDVSGSGVAGALAYWSGANTIADAAVTIVPDGLLIGAAGTDDGLLEIASSASAIPWTIGAANGAGAHRILHVGHNMRGGGRRDLTDVGWALAFEAHYDAGGGNILSELNLEFVSADGLIDRRPASWSVNEATGVPSLLLCGDVFFVDTDAEPSGTVRGTWTKEGKFGINAVPGSSTLLVSQRAATSGTPIAMQFIGGAHTGVTASQNVPDAYFNFARTVTFAQGAKDAQYAFALYAPTYAADGATTIAESATLFVSGAPLTGALVTQSDPLAALFAGAARINGLLTLRSNTPLRITDAGVADGLEFAHAGAQSWQLQPIPTGGTFTATKTFGLGYYARVEGMDGTYNPAPRMIVTSNGIGVLETSTIGMGFSVRNEIAATGGTPQQWSPWIEVQGHAWTGAASVQHTTSLREETTNAATTTGALVIKAQAGSAGSWNELARFAWDGATKTIGVFGHAAAAQTANLVALADNTGGTPSATELVDVETTGLADFAKINDNFASISDILDNLLAHQKAHGWRASA